MRSFYGRIISSHQRHSTNQHWNAKIQYSSGFCRGGVVGGFFLGAFFAWDFVWGLFSCRPKKGIVRSDIIRRLIITKRQWSISTLAQAYIRGFSASNAATPPDFRGFSRPAFATRDYRFSQRVLRPKIRWDVHQLRKWDISDQTLFPKCENTQFSNRMPCVPLISQS